MGNKRNVGFEEDRTRVTLFLPVHKNDDLRAFRQVIDYLHAQRKSKSCRVTGYTYSTFPNASFFGVWWSSRKGKWIPEKVSLLIVDYAMHCKEPALGEALSRL